MLISKGNLAPDSLKGEVAVVTGAGRGIGYEAARALIWLGANVAVAEINVFFDRMATYEERDLIRILGEKYLNYQKQVPKWLMHIRRGNK